MGSSICGMWGDDFWGCCLGLRGCCLGLRGCCLVGWECCDVSAGCCLVGSECCDVCLIRCELLDLIGKDFFNRLFAS